MSAHPTTGGPAGALPQHLEFATFEEGYLGRYIALADTKAGVVFSVSTAALGFLLGQEGFRKALIDVAPTLEWAVAAVAGALLALTGALSFLVIAPRASPAHPRGLIYWEDVATREDPATYAAEVLATEPALLTDARLRHCRELAGICSAKYRWLRRAIRCGAIALIAALAAITQL